MTLNNYKGLLLYTFYAAVYGAIYFMICIPFIEKFLTVSHSSVHFDFRVNIDIFDLSIRAPDTIQSLRSLKVITMIYLCLRGFLAYYF